MTTFTRPVSSLDASTIHSLVENAVAEGLQLEYKRDLPGTADADKREFLANVSSLANTRGGDIIFGIADKNDIAISTPGVLSPDCGPAILRLESLIRDGIAPRLSGVQSWPVPLTNDRSALVLRVPKPRIAAHGDIR
ncbi:MAG: ATP-binding protein [Gemmatimonadetes bacterium]|nr:ATP-binding protein [Gemmatimonadota bacterium]